MDSIKGNIFNIQKFSITDGVGIRTLIFMKGCPLRCKWCSNPESQKYNLEIMDVKVNCTGCGKCAVACENGAVDNVTFDVDRTKCTDCGKCTRVCFANAKKMVGKEYTIEEVMKQIEKDRIFYRNSGGGVTIGGGEPTAQAPFVSELLKYCQKSHINTAIETCGYGKWENIEPVFRYTDQVFFDLKSINSEIHKKYTGVGNELILENAAKATEVCNQIIFRVPLIPRVNDNEENLRLTGEFVSELQKKHSKKNIAIELLPFHNFGASKYRWMNVPYEMGNLKPQSNIEMEKNKDIIRRAGATTL